MRGVCNEWWSNESGRKESSREAQLPVVADDVLLAPDVVLSRLPACTRLERMTVWYNSKASVCGVVESNCQ